MSEVQIRVGGRPFTVACQPGEEKFLESAAKMLDAEASPLVEQLGKMPETQMLLMAGLILADKTAALQEKLKGGKGKGKSAAQLPDGLEDRLSGLADQAEAVADKIEKKAAL